MSGEQYIAHIQQKKDDKKREEDEKKKTKQRTKVSRKGSTKEGKRACTAPKSCRKKANRGGGGRGGRGRGG